MLITGGTGFLGTNLTRELLRQGCPVHLLVRPTSDRDSLADVAEAIHWHLADLIHDEPVGEVVRQVRPAVVFHLASSSFNPPTTGPLEHARVNLMGTLHLLEALRMVAPDARLVSIGSAAEYGAGSRLTEEAPPAPTTLLGATKAAATTLIQAYAHLYGLRAVVLRLFTPFGPYERRGRLIPHTILSALRGEDVALTDGRQRRDFLYAADVVDALVRAAHAPTPPGAVINICSGQGTTVLQAVETILRLMGSRVRPRPGALPTRKDEIWELSGSRERARQWLGWAPDTTLEDGLGKAIEWWGARANARVGQLT